LTPAQKSLVCHCSGLPDGVTVAQQTLDLFVMVQIHVGQPLANRFLSFPFATFIPHPPSFRPASPPAFARKEFFRFRPTRARFLSFDGSFADLSDSFSFSSLFVIRGLHRFLT
jgi:hypothetical protein